MDHHSASSLFQLASEIGSRYAVLPQVEAVALAGSQTAQLADPGSDLDFYVYVHDAIPLADRIAIAETASSRAETDNQFWEPGDEWIDAQSGVGIDVMFRSVSWIEDQIDRVLRRHEASVGYSTCFWHNVRSSRVVFDRSGWFARLQQHAAQPYPETLRRAIVAKNLPILRRTISSYRHQIERALARRDAVSVNHRTAAFLASYFDILFAVNRLPHPGEKRLVQIALERCALLPAGLQAQVQGLIGSVASGDAQVLVLLDALVDALEALLRAERLDPLPRV